MSSAELNDFIDMNTSYELKIGKSFQTNPRASYHQFKYDFTPASIDKNQESNVKIGEIGDVVIQVPHIEGSAQKFTQFTGNRQPTSKECVLIFDPQTKEFTLERLQTNFILKRSRLEGSSKAQIITPRAITPTNEKQKKKKETGGASGAAGNNDSNGATPTTSVASGANEAKRPTGPPGQQSSTKQKEPQSNVNNNSRRDTTPPPPPPPPRPLSKTEQLFGNDFNLSEGSDSNDEM